MKLASEKNGNRDGQLIIVNKQGTHSVNAPKSIPTLQYAIDHWDQACPELIKSYDLLNQGKIEGRPIQFENLLSPLPRAYEWIDGSSYMNHVELVRKARGASVPEDLYVDPLIYQGGSSQFISPRGDIKLHDEAWGCDFESEIAVILSDTPERTNAKDAHNYIKLFMLCNDISLRNLIPKELEKGFGFFNSKPASAFSPFAVTIDEISEFWRDGRLHLPLITKLNDEVFGRPNAGPEMHFSFYQLIAHITKTRSFSAGTILGSGTVSNKDTSLGSSCLAEKRMLEKINHGEIKTPFLKFGDHVQIEMISPNGENIFGTIHNKVKQD